MPGVPGLFLRSEALAAQGGDMPSLTSRADTALLPASLAYIPDDTAHIELSQAHNVRASGLKGAAEWFCQLSCTCWVLSVWLVST